jgi:hypothetical protein
MKPSHHHTRLSSAASVVRSRLVTALAALALAVAALLVSAGPALAQTAAFAVDSINDTLYRVDLNTGAVTPVGAGVGFNDVTSLSFSPGGVLFGIDSNTDSLITINTATGVGTLVGALGVNVSSDTGLTFDSSGNLWLSQDNGDFFRVNPVTGAATFIGNLGEGDVEGLAAFGNVIFGLGETNNRIGTINTTTGVFTPIGTLGFDVGTDLGLDFAPDGRLFGIDTVERIFIIDPATGMGTLVATLQQDRSFESLAIAAEKSVVMNPAVSDQKAGSLLVFPYYNSASDGSFSKADTLITISNVCNGAATSAGVPNYSYLHLFFINGQNCSPADTFVCLTPNGSVQLKASDYDPTITGYLIAVAVNSSGAPIENNCFIGSAFVRDDTAGIVDSYGAEAFRSYLGFGKGGPIPAPVSGGNASINFNGVDYDLAPTQFSAQVQDPAVADEFIALAALNGNLGTKLDDAKQTGTGLLYRADETPASFPPLIGAGCQSLTAVGANLRIVPVNINTFLKDSYGYLKFSTSPAVGLLISRQGAANQSVNRFSGIRALHKTQVSSATLTAPCFPPFCGF